MGDTTGQSTYAEAAGPAGRRPSRPPTSGRAWTSFVADGDAAGRAVRALHEEANPDHCLRVEHDAHTLLIHPGGEDGPGWTTIAVGRATRTWAVAQHERQSHATGEAFEGLYGA
jgi:hypothetical protein